MADPIRPCGRESNRSLDSKAGSVRGIAPRKDERLA
jgi:hypothetical protein